jgi:hypothetical protein
MEKSAMKCVVRPLLLTLLGLSLLISACQSTQPTDAGTQSNSGNDTSTLAAQTGDVSSSEAAFSGEPTAIPIPETIEWSRDPSAIIFRAEITSGAAGDTPETAYIRNEVPPCTIYGDNRVVWTTTTIRTDDGVVFDVLPDEAIRDFILRLILAHNFYGYPNSIQTTPDDNGEIPVVERLMLTINGETYVTDSFSGWDYTYFREIMEDCRSLSETPVAFEPQGAWVTVRDMGYNPSRPNLYWDAEANGLQLVDLAMGNPQWMTGAPLNLLWQTIRSGGIDILLQENGTDYLVTVEVPNITRNAPPAPSS